MTTPMTGDEDVCFLPILSQHLHLFSVCVSLCVRVCMQLSVEYFIQVKGKKHLFANTMNNRLLMTGIWAGKVSFLIDKLDNCFLFSIQVHFQFIVSTARISFQLSPEQRKLTEYTNKSILFLNKWQLMGCPSHLCSSPLTDDAPTFYSCIT